MSSRRSAAPTSAWARLRLPLGAAVSGLALAGWGYAFGLASLWASVVRPMLSTTVFLAGGLLLGQLLETTNYSARVGLLFRPLLRWSHLPPQAGAAFTAAFISGLTANALLFTSWQEGRLSRRELILANLLCTSLPSYFLHLPTTLFIIGPLVGSAGLAYLGLTLLAALARLAGVAVLARLTLGPDCHDCRVVEAAPKGLREVWAETWPKFRKRLVRLLVVVIPIYLAVSLAVKLGFFVWLRQASAGWLAGLLLPVEAMGVVVFAAMAEFSSGAAAAGALLAAGELGFKEVVLALLLGTALAAPLRALRHQLAHYLAIFPAGLGLCLMLLGQASRVASLAVAAALFWWLT